MRPTKPKINEVFISAAPVSTRLLNTFTVGNFAVTGLVTSIHRPESDVNNVPMHHRGVNDSARKLSGHLTTLALLALSQLLARVLQQSLPSLSPTGRDRLACSANPVTLLCEV